jgi:hypothetical protein
VPKPLWQHLKGHEFLSVHDMGWEEKKNGELLALMSGAGFQALLTVDQNLPYQQNIPKSGIAVVVMAARGTRVADLLPSFPKSMPLWPRFSRERWLW